jgi:hypothetical protein
MFELIGIGITVALAAIGFFYFKGKKAGKKESVQKAQEKQLDKLETQNKIQPVGSNKAIIEKIKKYLKMLPLILLTSCITQPVNTCPPPIKFDPCVLEKIPEQLEDDCMRELWINLLFLNDKLDAIDKS